MDGPGEWQARMLRRLQALGYDGFMFGPGIRWWAVRDGIAVAGPFPSTAAFDAWLDDQEAMSAIGNIRTE
jgi:hypothetical protein